MVAKATMPQHCLLQLILDNNKQESGEDIGSRPPGELHCGPQYSDVTLKDAFGHIGNGRELGEAVKNGVLFRKQRKSFKEETAPREITSE